MPSLTQLANQYGKKTETPEVTGSRLNQLTETYTFGRKQQNQTAYQANLSQPVQTEKWYKGSQPTEYEVLGRIGKIYGQDQARGQKLLNDYLTLQSDPTSAYWNPYTNVTNRSVSNLAGLGIDASNLSDEWFEQNRWLRGHYIYNGTTNAPSKPGKDATPTQLAAYEYHQLEKAWDDTKNAKSEWEALQDELKYMATCPDRNYSDDEIIERIDWKKYPTLAKMDSSRNGGEPIELDTPVGYSRTALYGVLWAARNDGGTGDLLSDTISSASGVGNQYQVNADIRDRLDPNSDKWSPFSVGSTMEEARRYFGVTEFNDQWLKDNRYILNGTDQHAIDMYQKVYAAEEHMKVLESQLDAMYKDIDEMLGYGYEADYIIDTIFSDKSSYGELFDLDKSMKSGVLGNGLVDTTRAIDYRRADVEAYIRGERGKKEEETKSDAVVSDQTTAALDGRRENKPKGIVPKATFDERGYPSSYQGAEEQAVAPGRPALVQSAEEQRNEQGLGLTSEDVNEPEETAGATETPVNNLGSEAAGLTDNGVNAETKTGESTVKSVSEVAPEPTASTNKNVKAANKNGVNAKDLEVAVEKEKHERKNISALAPTIQNKGTNAEKTVFRTTGSPEYAALAQGLTGIRVAMENARESIEINLGETAARDYLPAIKVVREYEGTAQRIANNKAYLEYAQSEYDRLRSQYEASGNISAGERYGITELRESDEADDIREALLGDDEYPKWNAIERIYNIVYPEGSKNFSVAAQEVLDEVGGDEDPDALFEAFLSKYDRVQPAIDRFLNGIPDASVANFRLSDEEMRYMDEWKASIEKLKGDIAADEEKLVSMAEAYNQAVSTRDAIANDYETARKLFGDDINTELLDRYEVWADAAGQWNAYPFTGSSPWDDCLYAWDQAVRNGEDTSELLSPKVLETYAASAIEDASRRLHYLNVMKDNMEAYGLSPSKEELSNVEQTIEVLQKELDEATWFYASQMPDFADKVQEGKAMPTDGMSDLTKQNVEFMLHGYKPKSYDNGVAGIWESFIGQYSNDPFFTQFFSSPSQDADEFRQREAFIVNYFNAMTEVEKDRYFYLLKEEGEDAANNYLKAQVNDVNGTIPHRVSEAYTEAGKEYAKAGTGQSIVSEVGAFFLNLIGNVESLKTNIRNWGNKNVDPKGIGYIASDATDALRQGVIENLTKGIEDEETKSFIDLLMNSFNSFGDSMINSYLVGGALSTIGESVPYLAKAYKWLKAAQAGEYGRLIKFGANAVENWLSAVPMGLQAADKAAREARANGATPDQEGKMWTVTFLAETLTEAVTIGNIKDMWEKGAKGEVVGLFKEYIFNGIEEAVGEGINQYWEENADTIIMDALSDRAKYIAELKANGVPPTMAEQMADARMQRNVAIAAASGFISSTMSQSTSNILGTASSVKTDKLRDNMLKSNIAVLSEVDTQGGGKSNTAAISSVLQDNELTKKTNKPKNEHQANIASQWFVGEINNGSGLNAKRTMVGLLSASGQNLLEVKAAVTYGSLTSGNTNKVLKDISENVANGGAVTEENVNELLEAVNEDRTGDQADFLEEEFTNTVFTGMVANRVQEIIAKNDAVAERVRNAQKAVRAAQTQVDTSIENKEAADANVEAVTGNVKTAVEEQIESPSPEGNAPVEQNLKQLEGAVEQQNQAEIEQKQAEEKLEQAQKDASEVEDQTLNEVRTQAEADVTQQMEDEYQKELDEFKHNIEYYHPAKPFDMPVYVARSNGYGKVQLTGVYAIMPDGQYVYSTPDGYITDNELDAWDDDDLPILDSAMEGWKKSDNPTAPVEWMPHSLKAVLNETGEVVDLIGFVGQQDGFDPVVMDANGNVYTSDQFKMEPDPFTGDNGNQALFDAFEEAGGESLPEYTPQPSAEMPEGVVMYPNGPQEMQANGETYTVVGVMNDFTNGAEYVLEDGTIAPSYQFSGESVDFLDWWTGLAEEQFPVEEQYLSEDQFEVKPEDLDAFMNSVAQTVNNVQQQHQNAPDSLELVPDKLLGYKGYKAPEGTFGVITTGEHKGENVKITGMYDAGAAYIYAVSNSSYQAIRPVGEIDIVSGDSNEWVTKAWSALYSGENTQTLPSQEDVDQAFEEAAIEELNKTNEQTGYTDGKVNKETGAPLQNWQDPKYHGKVTNTKAKTNPNSKAFKAWQNLENIPEEYRKYFVNPDGSPKMYYRGFGDWGHTLYVEHESHPFTLPNGKKASINFYMDTPSTAKSYAGTSKKIKLRYIKNWETAKAAMQDIGMDLIEKQKPDGSGQMGYQVVNKYGAPAHGKDSTWFAEDELARFRNTYGGKIDNAGIHAGFVTATNPLVLDGHGGSYYSVYADVTAPDGEHLDTTQKTRSWAKWAFSHGYDALIVYNVSDNVNGGGEKGVEFVTSQSQQFKSIYNSGNYSKTNPNILALKTTGKPIPLSKLEKAMGKRLSNEFYDVRERLNNGEEVDYEEIMSLPEVQWLEAHMKKGESLNFSTYYALSHATSAQSLRDAGVSEDLVKIYEEKGYVAAVESLFTPERVKEQHGIIQKILDTGSVVFDEKGKAQYTGDVKQGYRVDVLIGLPASGKSTIAEYLSNLYKSRLLDNDEFKALLHDFEAGLNSNYLHTESRFIHQQAFAEAIARGDNIILPVVGHSYNSVARQIKALKENGYDVHLHMTNLPQTKAVGRSLSRMVDPELLRYLPPAYLMGKDESKLTPEKISATYDRLVKEGLVDAYTKWNNDVPKGQKPVLIESSDRGDAGLFTGRGYAEAGRADTSGKGTTQGIQELRVPTPKTSTEKQARKTKAKLKSPQVIAQKLTKALGFAGYETNRFGELSPATRGFWDTHGKYLAVRNKEIGNLNVTFHELGHGLADLLKLTGTEQMVNNMIAANPAFATEYTVDQLQDEAFAEFMWRYMSDEQLAKDFAGEAFVNEFERKMLSNPKVYKAIKDAQNALHEWMNATTDERIAASIRYDKSSDRPSFHKFVQNAVSLLVDKSVAAEDVVQFLRDTNKGKDVPISQNLRAMSLLSNHSQKQAVYMLTDNLTDADGTIIAPGLGKLMDEVGFKGTEENIHQLERYMLAKHSLDRDAQGKPVFNDNLSTEERVKYVNEIEATRPDIVRAANAWQTFRHNFLQAWMVDTGYWSQEFLDHLEEMYPNYVPTFRVGGNVDSMSGIGGKKGRGYTLREAVGGSQDVYSPFYSFVGMVNQITSMVNLNRTAQVFDNLYQENEGLGQWARLLPEDEVDTHLVPDGTTLNARQQELMDLLSSEINEDLMEKVLEITKSKPGQRSSKGSDNILTVQRKDGTTVRYQFDNDSVELFKLLAGVQEKTNIKALDILGKMTRTMSMLTTGSNPLFAARNAVRDFQTSVNYGTWASNYLTGAVKWVRALAEVARGKSELYQSYKALGGGGWTYIDQGSRKSMKQIESEIFGDDKSTVGKTAKWLGKKIWNTITMERLNEIIEQASRFVEFKYGKHNTDTVEGRQEAFLAAQDTSVDFSRNGNSELAAVLKKLVPFFNASTQGVYRTTRQLSKGERSRAGVRLAKNVINTALASALASGLIMKFGDDDDKDEFANVLSSGIKANHLILPNPLKNNPGEPPFIRIPLAQDPITYAVHGLTTNAMWNGSTDEMAIDLAATADVILDNLNPLGSGTILQPFIDASHNRTWFGSPIIRNAMQDWTDPASQYNEDTPEFFKFLGRLTNSSPEIVEYIVQQYSGFLGETLIPALTKDKNGNLGGAGAILNSLKKKWTADPYSSNDVTNRFYSMKKDLETFKDEAHQNRPENKFLRSLTQEDVNNAYMEAEEMLKSNGLVGETSKYITDIYKRIDEINANDSLTDAEKAQLSREAKKEMVKVVEAANEQLEAYKKKYITGETLMDRTLGAIVKRFQEGAYAHVPTPEEQIPQTFQDDFDEPYMQKALSVYNGDGSGKGKTAALPHPSYSFTLKDKWGNEVECEITPSEADRYNQKYKSVYNEYLQDQSSIRKDHTPWDMLTPDEQYNRLKNAHRAANDAVKALYAEDHNIN